MNRPANRRSREISTKVGVESALRNTAVKGVHNAKNTFMGVDSTVVGLSVVLINIHEYDLALRTPLDNHVFSSPTSIEP